MNRLELIIYLQQSPFNSLWSLNCYHAFIGNPQYKYIIITNYMEIDSIIFNIIKYNII